jgi:biotin carboxylase
VHSSVRDAVLVLSVTSSALEDRVAAVVPGRVRVAMPAATAEGRRAAGPPYPVHPIEDWADLDEFRDLAEKVRAEAGVSNVVAAVEPGVRPAAFARAMLGIPGGISYETAVRCTDKHLMKVALAGAGLPVADHRVAHAFADIPARVRELGGYPIVVKPRDGFGAINTHRVRSAADLPALADAGVFGDGVTAALAPALTATGVGDGLAAGDAGFLVERYIDVAAEYHCEILRVAGRTRYAIPGLYMTPLLSDAATLGAVLLDPDSATGTRIRDLAENAVAALGIDDGFAHVELLEDRAGHWWVGEVGARRGGAALPLVIQLAYGLDTLDIDARWAGGEVPDPVVAPRPGEYGWAGVRIQRTGRIASIASRDDLLGQPDVIDAVILAQPDQTVAAGGTGLFAAYVFYRADTRAEVLAAMHTTADRLDLRYATR